MRKLRAIGRGKIGVPSSQGGRSALRALERALGDHEVVTAAGGRAALTRLADDPAFDLILCDVMMPDVDGVDVAEAVTARGLGARLVLISAGAITARTRAFLASSRCPILTKPLDVTRLLRQVAETPRRTPRPADGVATAAS